jgi:predicted nucleic acid-binding protein
VTLVDTNVLVDVLSDDPNWRTWSRDRLDECSAQGPLLINDIVYAELSARFAEEELLDEAISEMNLVLHRLPKPALFLAGRAFERYRRSGGTRTGVLPDFFIGAHAQAMEWPLLTRDVGRYRTYFPGVELIVPGGNVVQRD